MGIAQAKDGAMSLSSRLHALPVLKHAAVVILWLALGLFDFGTGFVEFSPLRMIWLIAVATLLLPLSFSFPYALERLLQTIQKPRYGIVFLILLAFLGYALFLSRYTRGANMGDDAIFREVITQTANGCFFCFPEFGGSYFAGHNNLFLILFIPVTVLPFWWLVAHLVHSAAIVTWCRLCGWSFGGDSPLGWYVTTALFFATYSQHAVFYDARFAALGLAIFAIGYYLRRRKLMVVSAIAMLVTRETTGLTLFVFGLAGTLAQPIKRLAVAVGILGLAWWIGSYILIVSLGGPIVPRFDDCLRLNPSHLPESSCLVNALTTDWSLKLAYTVRLLRFAPSLGAAPSLTAALPDLAFTWISKDNVLYSLSWHYYTQALGILIVGAGLTRKIEVAKYSEVLAVRWLVATSLWQFVTTFRINLF